MSKGKRGTAFRAASLLIIVLLMFCLGEGGQSGDGAYRVSTAGAKAGIAAAESGTGSTLTASIDAGRGRAGELIPEAKTALKESRAADNLTSPRVYANAHRFPALASRGEAPGRAGERREIEMEVVATGYSASREEGTEDGVTATGTKVRRGVAAVDPQVIPLGSEVYVPGYGWARAEDTGAAIKGRRVDLFFPTRDEAFRWGVKRVRVLVQVPE